MTKETFKLMVVTNTDETRQLTLEEKAMYLITKNDSYGSGFRYECEVELNKRGLCNIKCSSRGGYAAHIVKVDKRPATMAESIAWHYLKMNYECGKTYDCKDCPLEGKGCIRRDAKDEARKLIAGKVFEVVIEDGE